MIIPDSWHILWVFGMNNRARGNSCHATHGDSFTTHLIGRTDNKTPLLPEPISISHAAWLDPGYTRLALDDFEAVHPAHMRMLSPSEQQNSIFFRLPAELRNKVYKKLLTVHDVLQVRDPIERLGTTHKRSPIHLAILSTCRKSYAEAVDLLYSGRIFHVHSSLLTSFPRLSSSSKPVTSRSAISRIRCWQLTLRLDTDPRFTASQATAAFSGADYVELHAWQPTYDSADGSNLTLFGGIRGVRLARVSGCTEELAKGLERSMMSPIMEAQPDAR